MGRSVLLLVASCAVASGCRLLGVGALSCDSKDDCAPGSACVDAVCVLEGGGDAESDAGPGGADAGPDEDAGPDDVDAGPDDVDAGPDDVDAGPDDVDAGPIIPDGCGGPGALRDPLDTLNGFFVDEGGGATAWVELNKLHLDLTAGGDLQLATLSSAALTEDGHLIEVKANNGLPDDGYFRFSLRASAVDEAYGDDRIGMFWDGSSLRAHAAIGPDDNSFGEFAGYDATTFPRMRIRRDGSDVVLDVLEPGALEDGTEVGRMVLPPHLFFSSLEFMADGGSTGFSMTVDALNPHVDAEPFCLAETLIDPFDDDAWAPRFELETQDGTCTASEQGGALVFSIEPTTVDAECALQSRGSFSLEGSSITARVAAGPWFVNRDLGGAYAFGSGIRINAADGSYLDCGWDGPSVYADGSSIDYWNSSATYDEMIPYLRLSAAGGTFSCDALDENGAWVNGTTGALPFSVDRVQPTLFFSAWAEVTELSELTLTLVAP